MQIRLEQAQELILNAMDKKLNGEIFRCIFCDCHSEGLSVNGLFQLIDVRANIFAFVHNVDLGRSAVAVQTVKLFQTVGCDEVAEQSTKVQNTENEHGDTG